jgi:hypothetical protein
MKTKIVFVLSSFLLALSLTACPPGGSGTPGTSGQINATFSNPSGTTFITLEPFSSGAITHKDALQTDFVGFQGNRGLEFQFVPPLTSNRTCQASINICGLLMSKTGSDPHLIFAKGGTITATISGGNVNITANSTFTQKDGVTFDVEVNATIPYTP